MITTPGSAGGQSDAKRPKAGAAFLRLAKRDRGAKAFVAAMEEARPEIEAFGREVAHRYKRQQKAFAKLAAECQQITQKHNLAWEDAYGEPFPQSAEDWERWGARIGMPAEWIVKGEWTPADILALVEGYLLRLRDNKPAVRADGDPEEYFPAKQVREIFVMREKQFRFFLQSHPEIKTRRPVTKTGKPNPQRLLIDLVGFTKAACADAHVANDPRVQRRLESNLQRANLARELTDSVMPYIPGSGRRK